MLCTAMKLTKFICEVSDITLSSITSWVLCKDANNVGNTILCGMGGYACVRSTIRTKFIGMYKYRLLAISLLQSNNDLRELQQWHELCKGLERLNTDYKTFATAQNIQPEKWWKSYHTVVTSCSYTQGWHRSHAQTPSGWISLALTFGPQDQAKILDMAMDDTQPNIDL